MIVYNANPDFENMGTYSILGGADPKDNQVFYLSAYFDCPYEYEKVIKPKWWQFWKKPVVQWISTYRWERKQAMLYAWQVRAIGAIDRFELQTNLVLATLLHVMGGGYSGQVFGIQLEQEPPKTQYIATESKS